MGEIIELPRKSKSGKPRISYSQYISWKSKKSFNLGVEGWMEYIVQYFLDQNFEDKGWAEFGNDVESYVCERKSVEKFSEKEKEVMDKVETIGVFQDYFEIDFDSFVLVGFIDDRSEDWGVIRDYKTASKNSMSKYYGEDYTQLDFYAMKALELTGEIPKLEVCIIERKGNCMFSGGRNVLSVGEEVWNIERETTIERINYLKDDLRKVVKNISDHYKVFKLLNN